MNLVSKLNSARSHLASVLASMASDGYDVAHLTADAPHLVQSWCDGVLRKVGPQQRRGHGLSRLDARQTVDQVDYLRGRAMVFAQAISEVARDHNQAIIRHNRAARDRAVKLRARRRKAAAETRAR